MPGQIFLRRAAIFSAVAAAGLSISLPARAQAPGAVATPAAQGSTSGSPAACTIAPQQARFDFPLPHTARVLASGRPLKIIALGSSSTYGAGASSSAAAYPNRLAEELVKQ